MRILILFIVLLGTVITSACDPPKRVTADKLFLVTHDSLHHYNLKEYKQKFFLPYALEEISGLSYVKHGVLACIQDEDGKLFLYDYINKEISLSLRFWDSGDYEGVEIMGDSAYVVNSKGYLLIFNYEGKEGNLNTRKVNTPLGKKNDIEGLCYDKATNSLVMVCKGDSDIDKKKISGQALYQYNLDKHEFVKEPLFSVSKKDIKEFLETHKDNAYEEKRINFHPSGIALHPIDGNYYIIASTGKLMIVVSREGKIHASYPISPGILGQPEGICFAPNGDLFISSEGEGDKGYILRFEMK
ncbi:SdiA-regulated domain-containing protein [Reichenbachiella sp. MALMAid0571]|uniref:SdiA-regulated domain-containing protein n=1 Tax=Reichenbachiella sp. MALMAid0571 TaxID=3143939 RepID=UPI0032DE9A0F